METYHDPKTEHQTDEESKGITLNFWVVLSIICVIGILIIYFGMR